MQGTFHSHKKINPKKIGPSVQVNTALGKLAEPQVKLRLSTVRPMTICSGEHSARQAGSAASEAEAWHS